MSHIWLVYGMTESGDNWFLVFDEEPSEETIEIHILRDPWLKDEYDAECIQGWSIEQLPIERVF